MIQQPNLDSQPEEDLEEVLDLAAELAPPEKLAAAWIAAPATGAATGSPT